MENQKVREFKCKERTWSPVHVTTIVGMRARFEIDEHFLPAGSGQEPTAEKPVAQVYVAKHRVTELLKAEVERLKTKIT